MSAAIIVTDPSPSPPKYIYSDEDLSEDEKQLMTLTMYQVR